MWRFHEHCQTAIEEAYDKVLEPALELAMGVVYKNDEFLLSLGYEGPEAYLKDENGNPVIRPSQTKWENAPVSLGVVVSGGVGEHRKITCRVRVA